MTNHNDSSRFDGITEQIYDEEQDLALQAAVLEEDFPKRLERLHEVSGLTWAAFARAIGVDPKLVHRWRNGVEPRRLGHARPLPLRSTDARRHGDPRDRELPDELLQGAQLDKRPRRAQAQRRHGGA